MQFRLFGIPVEVQFGFWFTAVLLGFNRIQRPASLLIWVLVVFFSVLVHELGHAAAYIRYGARPEIKLVAMGGLTYGHGGQGLRKWQQIFVSFAGPLAGFIVAGIVYAMAKLVPGFASIGAASQLDHLRIDAVNTLIFVNFIWGLFNLVPVLPLDGGHILAYLLGPRRTRTAALVSLIFAAALAVWGFTSGWLLLGFMFAMLAMQSFQLWQAERASTPAARRAPADPPEEPVSPEMQGELDQARAAFERERFEQAGTAAELLLTRDPPRSVRLAALELLGWSLLLQQRLDEAIRPVRELERAGKLDPALGGGLLFAKGDHKRARAMFEEARANGDDRKEIVGPLIQILIGEGEVARAAAIALDIVDSLSDEDVRQMATIASDSSAHSWAARLLEALFERNASPDDAYDAARARVLTGDNAAAIALLQRAVAAGFSDGERIRHDAVLAPVAPEIQKLMTRGAE